MINLIIYSVICYSICNMIVYTSGPFQIFTKFRELCSKIHYSLYEMITCMICLPTYIGFLMSILNIYMFNDANLTPMSNFYKLGLNPVIVIFFDGIFTSGIVWLLDTIQVFLEKNSKDDNKSQLND